MTVLQVREVLICDVWGNFFDISDDTKANSVMSQPNPPLEVLLQMIGAEHLSEKTRMTAFTLWDNLTQLREQSAIRKQCAVSARA